MYNVFNHINTELGKGEQQFYKHNTNVINDIIFLPNTQTQVSASYANSYVQPRSLKHQITSYINTINNISDCQLHTDEIQRIRLPITGST